MEDIKPYVFSVQPTEGELERTIDEEDPGAGWYMSLKDVQEDPNKAYRSIIGLGAELILMLGQLRATERKLDEVVTASLCSLDPRK